MTYESYQSNFMTKSVVSRYSSEVVGIIGSSAHITGRSHFGAALYLLRHAGIKFILYKAAEIGLSRLIGLYARLLKKNMGVSSLREIAERFNLCLIFSSNMSSENTCEEIKRLNPDLIVSIYSNQLFGPRFIECIHNRVINVHPGLLPKNRGLFPCFWSLANGDKEAGVTVHWIDEKLDTGDIIVQERIPIQDGETVFSLSEKSCIVGAKLLINAIEFLKNGNSPKTSQNDSKSSYFSWPSSYDFRRLEEAGHRYWSLKEAWRSMTSPD